MQRALAAGERNAEVARGSRARARRRRRRATVRGDVGAGDGRARLDDVAAEPAGRRASAAPTRLLDAVAGGGAEHELVALERRERAGVGAEQRRPPARRPPRARRRGRARSRARLPCARAAGRASARCAPPRTARLRSSAPRAACATLARELEIVVGEAARAREEDDDQAATRALERDREQRRERPALAPGGVETLVVATMRRDGEHPAVDSPPRRAQPAARAPRRRPGSSCAPTSVSRAALGHQHGARTSPPSASLAACAAASSVSAARAARRAATAIR